MSTNYTQARDALITHFHNGWVATYGATPIFYENAVIPDLDKVGDLFVRVSVDFLKAVQSDMDIDTGIGHKVIGEITVMVFVKEGKGSRNALPLFDYITDLLKFQNLSGVQCAVPTPGRKSLRSGWLTMEMSAPFTFYSKF